MRSQFATQCRPLRIAPPEPSTRTGRTWPKLHPVLSTCRQGGTRWAARPSNDTKVASSSSVAPSGQCKETLAFFSTKAFTSSNTKVRHWPEALCFFGLKLLRALDTIGTPMWTLLGVNFSQSNQSSWARTFGSSNDHPCPYETEPAFKPSRARRPSFRAWDVSSPWPTPTSTKSSPAEGRGPVSLSRSSVSCRSRSSRSAKEAAQMRLLSSSGNSVIRTLASISSCLHVQPALSRRRAAA